MTPKPYADLVSQVAGAYFLPVELLQAQVMHESSGNPNAFRYEAAFFDHYIDGHSGARGFKYGPLAACSYGLIQIMLETAIEMGFDGQPQDLFVPRIGLAFGAKKMQALSSLCYGDYKAALACYNGGIVGNTTPPYRNQSYVDAVYALVG